MPELMSADEILRRLNERERKYDFPRACERDFWDAVKPEKKADMIKRAEEELESEIPLLLVKNYVKFFREGNRIAYEKDFFRRRQRLFVLTMAECAEYKGRFIDEIAEILWQILSEPVWCIPAHQGLTGYALPDPEDWRVDLFASETAKILVDVLQLLEPELKKDYLPLIRRIRHEITRRVLEPSETADSWWYKGSNNWSVWCCFSLNVAAMDVWQDDKERLAAFLVKHIEPMKRFFDHYPEDGGCDEGPCYWVVAVGMLLNGLDVLQRRLGGFEDWIADPKLKKMVEFIPRVNLCGPWFMGFSDAESFYSPIPRGIFLKYASMVGCDAMAAIALETPDLESVKEGQGNRNMGRIFEELIGLSADPVIKAERRFNAVDFWPDLQIWIARQNPEMPEKGIVCTLKGGNNRQSHNHLDLGHFTLWHNGQPVIIDVGRGIYDKTCFSDKRYTLWNLNSNGHNAARFNGDGQGLGSEYKTRLENNSDNVLCDLTGAYMAESGIKKYLRQLKTQWQENKITVTDMVEFEGEKTFEISLFTPVEPEGVSRFSLRLNALELACDGIGIEAVEPVEMTDAKIKAVWGQLWEIRLKGCGENIADWQISLAEF